MDRVRFVYTVNKNGRRVTMAYKHLDQEQGIMVSSAECSKKDRFVKKYGRSVAGGRLNSKSGGVFIDYNSIGGTRYHDVAQYLSNNVDVICSKRYI